MHPALAPIISLTFVMKSMQVGLQAYHPSLVQISSSRDYLKNGIEELHWGFWGFSITSS